MTISDAEIGQRHRAKYESKNPIQKWALDRFFRKITDIVETLKPNSILDFGCGEGFFLERLAQEVELPKQVLGIDIRESAIRDAQARLPSCSFQKIDLFEAQSSLVPFDLVVASQVLEHLSDPIRYLDPLRALSSSHLLLTVPHEPFFRLMNLMRGRDITRWGNHPEHVNHWNVRTFKELIQPVIPDVTIISSFPFLIAVASVNKNVDATDFKPFQRGDRK